MEDFRALADAVATDIRAGRLKPGDRLPPQRQFAWTRGIAVSTASRVYAELGRRGLTVGEVGRGTYVRDPGRAGLPGLEPVSGAVDLEYNFPILPEQVPALARCLTAIANGSMSAALAPQGPAGFAAARLSAARFFGRPGFEPDPDDILFTGNGRQGIAAALAALTRPGDRLGVEPLTYVGVRAIAARLGLLLTPLETDGEGLTVDGLRQAHAAAPLQAVYLQPVFQNPVGTVMSVARRQALSGAASALGIWLVEDGIYGFLGDETPMSAFAPSQTILVDSLSKRFAPGLALGAVIAPRGLRERLTNAIRAGAWGASGLSLAVGTRWMDDPSAADLQRAKRQDASKRQAIARQALSGLTIQGDPRAYHLWLELPHSWRAEAFAAALLRRGVAVTPSSAFAAVTGQAPAAVRVALASPDEAALHDALERVRDLAMGGPDVDLLVD